MLSANKTIEEIIMIQIIYEMSFIYITKYEIFIIIII